MITSIISVFQSIRSPINQKLENTAKIGDIQNQKLENKAKMDDIQNQYNSNILNKVHIGGACINVFVKNKMKIDDMKLAKYHNFNIDNITF